MMREATSAKPTALRPAVHRRFRLNFVDDPLVAGAGSERQASGVFALAIGSAANSVGTCALFFAKPRERTFAPIRFAPEIGAR